jgi:predicted RNase H-like HicB family nuclease
MLYPTYVHHDEGSAYGLTFPDFPGCYAAVDNQASLTTAAQEAVEAHFYGEADIPAASELASWANHADYQGGFWMLVDISRVWDTDKR